MLFKERTCFSLIRNAVVILEYPFLVHENTYFNYVLVDKCGY